MSETAMLTIHVRAAGQDETEATPEPCSAML